MYVFLVQMLRAAAFRQHQELLTDSVSAAEATKSHYQMVLEYLNPESTEVLGTLGSVHAVLEEYDESKEIFERALVYDPENEHLIQS